MSSPPILQLDQARIFRGDRRVFDRVDLEIPSGRNTAILGPNGAGKTTLLRVITRDVVPYYDPPNGARVLGRDRWNVFDLRRHLGIVSQELHLQHQRAVRGLEVALSGFFSSIGVPPHRRPTPEQFARARSTLTALGASHLEERDFRAMSAGEQRRCLLARALVNDPDTLLLDEPTASLDLRAAFDLIATLRGLMAAGKNLVLVTHHLQEIPPEVSWVLLLKDGAVLDHGPKERMLTADRLSRLFDVPLAVVEHEGFYQVLPS